MASAPGSAPPEGTDTTCTATAWSVRWVALPDSVAVTVTVVSLSPSPMSVCLPGSSGSVSTLRPMVVDAVSSSLIVSVAVSVVVSPPAAVPENSIVSSLSSMLSWVGSILIVVDASVWPAVMVTASGVSLAAPIVSVGV